MAKFSCVLETRSRVSGCLWANLGEAEAKVFAERSVGGLADGLPPGSALLQLEAAAGDRIEGADIGEDNTAVVWTQRGYIYTLDFAANRYELVGKPGPVTCCRLVAGGPGQLVAGLSTRRVILVQADTGTVKARAVNEISHNIHIIVFERPFSHSREIAIRPFSECREKIANIWLTALMKARLVEQEEVRGLDTAEDGRLVSVLTPRHLTLWSPPSAQPLLRLRCSPEAKVEFVSFLPVPSSEPDSGPRKYKLVTGCRNGNVAFWSITAADPGDRKSKPRAEVLHNVSLGHECQHFSVCLKSGFLAASNQSKTWKVDLENYQVSEDRNPDFRDKITNFLVTEKNNRLFSVVSSDTRTAFITGGHVLHELEAGGQSIFSRDGFLVLKVTPAGAVRVFRTDFVWSLDTVRPQSLPRVSSAAAEPRTGRESARSSAPTPRTPRPTSVRAERDYEAVLRQLTPATLGPVLRLGGLAFPAATRATIWAQLLGLPRDKAAYLALCRHHGSEPEQVLANVLHWSPHLRLVPHLGPLLAPVLAVFRGHPTTSWEAATWLLARYSWLASYPAPPPALATAWTILAAECPRVTEHVSELGATCRHVLWPLQRTWLASVLPPEDWLQVWDHLVTAGPGLLVAALVAAVSQVRAALLSCTSVTMVTNLVTSQLALNIKTLMATAHSLLDKHRDRIDSVILRPKVTKDGHPAPIVLDSESRSVLQTLNKTPGQDNHNVDPRPARTGARKVQGQVEDDVIGAALAVSPPPVPRLRTHSRRGGAVEDKENAEAGAAMAPLKPLYDYNEENEDDGEREGWDDINDLLKKAKLLRQVLDARK